MSVCPSQCFISPRRQTMACEVPSESSCALEDRRHNHKVRISERCFNWFHRRSHTLPLLHRPLHIVREQCSIRLSVMFWQAPEAKKIKLNTFSTDSTVTVKTRTPFIWYNSFFYLIRIAANINLWINVRRFWLTQLLEICFIFAINRINGCICMTKALKMSLICWNRIT